LQTVTSQDRRPPNFDLGLETQFAPRPARVREPDRETLRDFRDHLQAKGVSRKTLQT
jgi:hypothetical protein